MPVKTAEQVWGAVALPAAVEDPEEAAWIIRARRGDEAAFRWLLARYRQRVVRLAAHILRDAEEAEDAAQEAFIRAFRRLRAYRGEARFFTWLSHIVVRACLDRRRQAWWSRETSLDSPGEICASIPVQTAGEADLRMLVEALLDGLSPPMRAALVLRELEGMEYADIAQALRIPVGTVRSRLNVARARFRELWSAATQEAESV